MTKLLSFIGWAFINMLGRTLKIRVVNYFDRAKSRYAFAFWHGEQFIPCYVRQGEDAVIMSSLSKDGEIQAGILRRLGFAVVRGSSTRGGQRALVGMIRHVKRGFDAGFAIDGPKGPYKQAKPGIIYLAQKTGVPVVPMCCAAAKSLVFKKAWDKYELPLPFRSAVIVYGNPIPVSPSDDADKKAAELTEAVNSVSEFAHKNYWSRDPRVYLSNHPRPKILVIQPSRIGDVVFTGPAVHALRKKYPNAWIGWLVDERCAPVLEGNKDIDEVIVIDRRRLSPGYLLKLSRYLRSKNIDLSVDFHGLAKSAVLAFLAGARFKLASSSTNGMREFSWLVSKEVAPKDPASAHCVDRHFAVAEYLGASASDKSFNIKARPEDAAKAEKILTENGINPGTAYAVVHPGGGWTSRRWSPERFSALIERMSKEAGLAVVLVGGREGGAGEKGLNELIKGGTSVKITDLTGALSLGETMALLDKCAVFVGNEAGPMHIGAAMGAPAVAILGPTDPGRTGPYGGKTSIMRHVIECQPCRERSCKKRTCMELVTVDEVFEAVTKKLEAGGK